MNINDLTIGQLKDLQTMISNTSSEKSSKGLCCQLGEKVIIRTYSAGVWFGTLDQKDGDEIILKDARRMWQWWAKKSISLSGVAKHGIKHDKSKICPPVDKVWLQPIEIISLTEKAINSIQEAENVEAE